MSVRSSVVRAAGVLLMGFLLSSCAISQKNSHENIETERGEVQEENRQKTNPTEEAVDEDTAAIVGTWKAVAILVNGNVIAFEDVDNEIPTFYTNRTSLIASPDGTFTMEHVNTGDDYAGKWSSSWKEGADHAYLFETETLTRLKYDFELLEEGMKPITQGGELEYTTKDYETMYRAWIPTEDPDTLIMVDSELPISPVFEREGRESAYIAENKTGMKSKKDSQGTVQVQKEPDESDSGAKGDIYSLRESEPEVESPDQSKAIRKAKEYLEMTAFSRDGLADQLVYEGFSRSNAVYAADHCGADWMEQAERKAKEYLEVTSFSYNGLVEQLVHEGFSADEAAYGADRCGADWYSQASEKAAEYRSFMEFSDEDLIQQLEYEGFTYDQAVYGANHS